VSDKTFHLKSYKQCFTGIEFVDWLIEEGYTGSTMDEATQRDIGVEIGVALQNDGHIDHVTQEHKFKDKPMFYHWCCDDHSQPAADGTEAAGFRTFQEHTTERDVTIVKSTVFGETQLAGGRCGRTPGFNTHALPRSPQDPPRLPLRPLCFPTFPAAPQESIA